MASPKRQAMVADTVPVEAAPVTETSLVILGGRKKRGRPRVDETGVRLTAWVPTPVYDQIVKAANRREVSVSSLVRSLLMVRVKVAVDR